MACSSSAHSVGEAMLAIRSGRCDRVIAGGTEAPVSYGVHRAWAALRLLAMGPDARCRPFCYERGGVLLGEGSVFFVLERRDVAEARGAKVYATLRGYGARSDATHITAPNAQGQAATIAEALRTSGLDAEEVGHVSAHGTATLAGDVSETQALHAVFGGHAKSLMVSGTKSFHGHLLGGAGAVSLLASILAVSRGFIAPTVNYLTPEAELDLDYVPNEARDKVNVRASLCNAFGFGGSNASLIITP
jgi:3-oxoacyl-(acyl-carrier-protein) synthase